MTQLMPVPKYHQIYLVLREQLQEGRFVNGLPGELALMREFSVARVTVRRALERLAGEGLIVRQPGRGTTPTPTDVLTQKDASDRPQRAQLNGLLENLISMGLRTKVQVLSVDTVAASGPVAQNLQLAVGSQVQKAVRVRSTAQGPLSLITTYVPDSIAKNFGCEELAEKPILLLMEESGVRVGRAHQTISAKLADAEVARHLDLSVGSPLLAVQRLIYDEHDRPVQSLHGLYRPDRYEYELELSRVGNIDAKVWVSHELSARFH